MNGNFCARKLARVDLASALPPAIHAKSRAAHYSKVFLGEIW
jgi:hypothetical protein